MLHGADISDDNNTTGFPVGWFTQWNFIGIQVFNEHGHLQQSFHTNWANAKAAGVPRLAYGWPIAGQDNSILGKNLAATTPDAECGWWADYEPGGRPLPSISELEAYVRGCNGGFYSNLSELPRSAYLDTRPWWFANPSNNPAPRSFLIEQYGVINGVDVNIAADQLIQGDFVATVDDIAAGVQKGMLSVVQGEGLSGNVWQSKLDAIIANQEEIITLLKAGGGTAAAHGTIDITGKGTF